LAKEVIGGQFPVGSTILADVVKGGEALSFRIDAAPAATSEAPPSSSKKRGAGSAK
jgi:hypothetical protein